MALYISCGPVHREGVLNVIIRCAVVYHKGPHSITATAALKRSILFNRPKPHL